MKQILLQLDERMLANLERHVPGSSRKRSEFIRDAIEYALLKIQEEKTYEAYLKHPQEPGFPFDPDAWAPESEAIHSFSKRAVKARQRAAATRRAPVPPRKPKPKPRKRSS